MLCVEWSAVSYRNKTCPSRIVEIMAAKEILIFFFSTVISPSLSDNVLSLTDVDFEDRVFGSSSHFVMFYGPW